MELTMVGRRKKAQGLPLRLYRYQGKRRDTFYTITAANEYINLGHDLVEAKRRLRTLDDEQTTAGSIGELLDDYLAHVKDLVSKGKRSARTFADNEDELVNLKLAFGKMAPRALQPHHVWNYLHKYRGKQAPIRANREISLLKSAFNWARGQGIVRDNPCAGVERNEETSRDRLVTHAELESFCAFARANGHVAEHLRGEEHLDAGARVANTAELAWLTGKGQAQVLRMLRSQAKEDGIHFGKRKGGASTIVEWTDRLRECVARCEAMPARLKSVYVVFNREGQPYTSAGFKALWNRLMHAWIDSGREDPNDAKSASKNEWFTFHDLRAKSVTDLITQGRQASELTGHREEKTVATIYDRRRVRKSRAVE